ncbi:MAG: WD40 repeat domain-containing protein [Planctomycetes bacterium]|nr:WD40 repeat domain-containing protein [Planctomycetota bacterium]
MNRAALLCTLLLASGGCSRRVGCPTPDGVTVRFTRCGAVADAHGRPVGRVSVRQGETEQSVRMDRLSPSRVLLSFGWTPKARYRFFVKLKDGAGRERDAAAPISPGPEVIASVALENIVSVSAASMGGAADTEVRFSPDGKTLAIGSYLGYLRLVDVLSGAILYEKKISEGLVKQLAFSRDGKTLFIGEQSPDAFVYAMDVETKKTKWRFRLADDLETCARKEDDRFGIYKLPGVYRMCIAEDGDVIVAGVHSWSKEIAGKTVSLNRSRLYRLDPTTGKPKWRFPKPQVLPASIVWFDADDSGKHVVLAIEKSSTERVESPWTPDSIYFVDGDAGKAIGRFTPEPLLPHFKRVLLWRSAGLSRDGRHASLGCLDGRAFFFDFPETSGDVKPIWAKDLGTPIVVSGVPLSAPVSYSYVWGDTVYFVVTGTVIPQGSRSASQKVPSPHPNTNSIFAFDLAGDLKWKWHTEGAAQAMSATPGGRYVLITTADNWLTQATDTFGFALFDTHRAGGGLEKLIYEFRTAGPVFPESDISSDGRFIAVAETPKELPDKTIAGAYRVHIVQ